MDIKSEKPFTITFQALSAQFVMEKSCTAKSAINLWVINENEKSIELVRTKTNSCGVSSFEFVMFVANFFHTRMQSVQSAKYLS